ncbi:hypothetical protein V6Z12_D11G125800 [Gossypium hirsutum]
MFCWIQDIKVQAYILRLMIENGWDITFVGIRQGLLIQSCKWVLDIYPKTRSPQIM